LYLLIVQMGGPVLQQVAQVTQVASTSTLWRILW
jgi:hypothetical protein